MTAVIYFILVDFLIIDSDVKVIDIYWGNIFHINIERKKQLRWRKKNWKEKKLTHTRNIFYIEIRVLYMHTFVWFVSWKVGKCLLHFDEIYRTVVRAIENFYIFRNWFSLLINIVSSGTILKLLRTIDVCIFVRKLIQTNMNV